MRNKLDRKSALKKILASPKEAWTVKEASEITGYRPASLLNLLAEQKGIRSVRAGRGHSIQKLELMRFVLDREIRERNPMIARKRRYDEPGYQSFLDGLISRIIDPQPIVSRRMRPIQAPEPETEVLLPPKPVDGRLRADLAASYGISLDEFDRSMKDAQDREKSRQESEAYCKERLETLTEQERQEILYLCLSYVRYRLNPDAFRDLCDRRGWDLPVSDVRRFCRGALSNAYIRAILRGQLIPQARHEQFNNALRAGGASENEIKALWVPVRLDPDSITSINDKRLNFAKNEAADFRAFPALIEIEKQA